MKVYQLIYTCAEHCIDDIDYGFIDKRGYGVYSYTKGLPKDDINDCVKYMNYRLPSGTLEDNQSVIIPPPEGEPYPKVYRTFKMNSGKYVCVQSTFLGLDINGENRNFISHALIIDCEDDGSIPKLACFYNSPTFLSDLTDEMKASERVEYLEELDSIKINPELISSLEAFVASHKPQLSYLTLQMLDMLASVDKRHLMLSSKGDLAVSYLMALKFILPNALAAKFGISTYNVNIPSDKQKRIRLHATKTGYNNITDELITIHSGCVFIDADGLEEVECDIIKLVDMTTSERAKFFDDKPFEYPEQLSIWLKCYDTTLVNELLVNLEELRDNCGNVAYIERVSEIFNDIDNPLYDQNRLDILASISNYAKLFDALKFPILKRYADLGFRAIVNGEDANLEGAFAEYDVAEDFYHRLDDYMSQIMAGNIVAKNAILITRLFALIKQRLSIPTWKEFFNNNATYLCEFVEACALVIINDTQPVTFIPPAVWTTEELAEIVAYFDSSTDDYAIKSACRKFILSNPDIKWGVFGIALQKAKRSDEDAASDIKQIKTMLWGVGYMPFDKHSYQDLRFRVINDINSKENPLLIERLLYTFYNWQSKATQLAECKQLAERLGEMILELRETERSCYDYMFPKLGLEILDTPCSYHEIIINADTMTDDFWNWFMISYLRLNGDDDRLYIYQRVYDASREYLDRSITSRIDKII